jgi:hypothetical protein
MKMLEYRSTHTAEGLPNPQDVAGIFSDRHVLRPYFPATMDKIFVEYVNFRTKYFSTK